MNIYIHTGISIDIKTKEKEEEKADKLKGKKGSKKSNNDDYYLRGTHIPLSFIICMFIFLTISFLDGSYFSRTLMFCNYRV
jgi:hypothetical protein